MLKDAVFLNKINAAISQAWQNFDLKNLRLFHGRFFHIFHKHSIPNRLCALMASVIVEYEIYPRLQAFIYRGRSSITYVNTILLFCNILSPLLSKNTLVYRFNNTVRALIRLRNVWRLPFRHLTATYYHLLLGSLRNSKKLDFVSRDREHWSFIRTT